VGSRVGSCIINLQAQPDGGHVPALGVLFLVLIVNNRRLIDADRLLIGTFRSLS
jgi:hypothetical protein